jgi:hypothetical protein
VPWATAATSSLKAQRWVSVELLTKIINQLECRGRESEDRCRGLRVAARQGVDHHVRGTGLILDTEVEAKEFAHPLVLRDRRESLVRQVFQTKVVICGKLRMPWRDLHAEEFKRAIALVADSAKAGA